MSKAYDAVVQGEQTLLLKTYSRYPVALVRGAGSRVWDVDGKEYIDLLAGIAVAGLGHCNEELCEALNAQAHTLWQVSNLFYQKPQLELARRLLSTTHHGKAFFCNSGAEANEACIKLARRYQAKVAGRPQATEIITIGGCFHGRTLGTLAATGRDSLSDGFRPIPEGFTQVPAGDLDAMEKAVTEKTAAVMLEVIQGEGGVVPLDAAYVQGVERICRRHGALFICDEVQAGMGRTGCFWAFQTVGVKPDIISVAKSLANGLAMGAMLATDEAAKGFDLGSHATTFGGGAITAAVAAKVVEIMLRDKLPERAGTVGAAFLEYVRGIQAALPGKIAEVRGRGLMIGIELAFDATAVWKELIARGFICSLSHGRTLRLLPPLNVPEADLYAFADALKDILAAL